MKTGDIMPGNWYWTQRGNGDLVLLSDTQHRPVVLTVVAGRLSVRDQNGVMTPLKADHPLALAIEKVPQLLRLVEGLLSWDRMDVEDTKASYLEDTLLPLARTIRESLRACGVPNCSGRGLDGDGRETACACSSSR